MQYYNNVETIESETEGRRYIDPETGDHYPSITTVLGHYFSRKFADFDNQELLEELKNRGAYYGNILHAYAENYLLKEEKNKLPPTDYVGKALFKQIRPYIDESLSKVYFTEGVVIDRNSRTAGRVDCFGVWNTIDSIVDFKTSRIEKQRSDIVNYFLQMSFYGHCLDVNQGVILMSVENLNTGLVFVEPDLKKFFPAFLKIREIYKRHKGF